MQAKLSAKLLTRKLNVLKKGLPEVIVTANIGCRPAIRIEGSCHALGGIIVTTTNKKSVKGADYG
jgi:hypothetical protein